MSLGITKLNYFYAQIKKEFIKKNGFDIDRLFMYPSKKELRRKRFEKKQQKRNSYYSLSKGVV